MPGSIVSNLGPSHPQLLDKMKQRLTKKGRSKSIPELPEIVAHAHQLLQKEKQEGYLECCLQADSREEPILPWLRRFVKLENGSLAVYENDEDLSNPVVNVQVVDLEGTSATPFQIGYFDDGVMHVLGFQADQEATEQWLKSIEAIRQLNHLASSDAFEKKAASPKPLMPMSPSFSRLSRKLVHSESQRHIKVEPEEPPPPTSPGDALRRELEEIMKPVAEDPVAAVWQKFLLEMINQRDTIDDLKVTFGLETHIDIFCNFEEVLEKSLEVMKAYVKAKENPSQFGNEFKDKCKDLEVFSSFSANKESAIALLKKKSKAIKESGVAAKLQEMIAHPLDAIAEFSATLKKFADDQYFPSTEFDEASAILQDVKDNIQNVVVMFQDWFKTTADPFRKHFLSPAKRSLIYVDSTLDLPAMLFTDVLVFFDLCEDDQGKEQHQVAHVFPLALIEVEENGKITKITSSTLNRNCQVKSPNNRAGNVFRRKILDARAKLASEICVGLAKTKALPTEFPTINCCVTYGDQLIVGTDKGLYTLNLKDAERSLTKVANCDRRISKIELSKALEIIIFSQQDLGSETVELYSYPLLSLNSHFAVQKHIHPEKIPSLDKVHLFCSFDNPSNQTRKLILNKDASLFQLLQDRNTDFVQKSTQELEERPSILKYSHENVYIGTTKSFMRYTTEPPATHVLYKKKDDLVPLDILVIGSYHLFCFSEHGLLYDSKKEKDVLSTTVWTESAHSFAFLDPFLLVVSENYIEVRHKDTIWEVKQTLPSPKVTVINGDDHYITFKEQIFRVQKL